jgi:hypothetical protein
MVVCALCLAPLVGVAQSVAHGTVAPKDDPATSDKPYRMEVALKTNLLFWAVGSPNFSVEIPLGDHFSVTASSAYTKISIRNTYTIQTLQGGLDAKYWFRPREGRTLTGWNAGVYIVSGAPWDVQWETGWQGDSFLSAGVQAGYSLPIARKWNLEFLLAGGLFYTPEARQYEKVGNELMWLQTRGNVRRFSLTKAQVNLVWHFGKKK